MQTIAAAGFEQVSDFSFSKIFDLVAEYMNIGTAGKGAGAIERAESNVQPGKKYDRALVGNYFVVGLPEVGLEPFRKIGALLFGKRGGLFFYDVMNTFAKSLPFKCLEYHWEYIRSEVGESVGHPCYRSTRYVVDHFNQSFDLNFGCFGSTATCDNS